MKKKTEIENKKEKLTFSKKLITAVLILAEIDIQIVFITSLLNYNGMLPENLAIAIVTEIIGAILIYSVKAYFETKSEKKQEFEEYKFEQTLEAEDNRGE